MKKTILVEGIILPIYRDWENQRDMIGEGKLLEKIKEGLPFILNDVLDSGVPIPVGRQIVYSYEEWKVKLETVVNHKDKYKEGNVYKFKIRKYYMTGISPSGSPNLEENKEEINIDSFLKVNGKEIY